MQTLAGLKSAGLVGAATHGVHPAPGAAPKLALLAGQVTDFVESYFVAARAWRRLTAPIERQGPGAPHP